MEENREGKQMREKQHSTDKNSFEKRMAQTRKQFCDLLDLPEFASWEFIFDQVKILKFSKKNSISISIETAKSILNKLSYGQDFLDIQDAILWKESRVKKGKL